MSCAITAGLGLVVLMTLFVVGFTAAGLAIGIGIGFVASIVVTRLAMRSGRRTRRTPPPDFL